jgi:hypothetical protein
MSRQLFQDDNLAALRSVLLVQERAQLKALRHRLDDPATRAAEVAAVLPAALSLAAAKDDHLTAALVPVVRTALSESLREHPDLLIAAVRSVLWETLRAPARLLAAWLRRKPRPRHMPARLLHLYLVDRLTGTLLDHQTHQPPDQPIDDVEARAIASMTTYLLAFLREPEHLARYATLRQLRIERHTYAIFAGAGHVLLAILEGHIGMEAQLAACEQMLISADQGKPLPPSPPHTPSPAPFKF